MKRKKKILIPVALLIAALPFIYFFFIFFPDDSGEIRKMALQQKQNLPAQTLVCDLISRLDGFSFSGYPKDFSKTVKDFSKLGILLKQESLLSVARNADKIFRIGTGRTGIWIDERRSVAIPAGGSFSVDIAEPSDELELSALSVSADSALTVKINGKLMSEQPEPIKEYRQTFSDSDVKMKNSNVGFPRAFDDLHWRTFSYKSTGTAATRIEIRNDGKGTLFVANPRLFRNAANERYNVIYIVFDGVSTKFWSFYNNRSGSTPQMKKIAGEDFIVFDNLFTIGNKTRISTCALYTSLFPYKTGHGVNRNSLPQEEKEIFYSRVLAKEIDTLPLVFGRNGYITAQFGNNGFTDELTSSGIDYGFDSSYEFQYNPYDTIGISREYFDFLKNNARRNFFVYTHYNTTHKPFYSPAKYYWRALTNSPWEIFWRPTYAACLSYGDDLFQSVYDSLRSKGLTENSIIVFATDHGSEYSYKKYMSGFLGNETSRMTFMIHLPEKLKKKLSINDTLKRINTYTSSIDIAPTLVELSGITIPRQFAGKSMTGLLTGKNTSDFFHDEIWTFGRYDSAFITKDKMKYIITSPDAERKFHYSNYIYGKETEVPFEEIYDLNSDPDENVNLANSRPDLLSRMRKIYLSADNHLPERLVLTLYPSLRDSTVSLSIDTAAKLLFWKLYDEKMKVLPDVTSESRSGGYRFTIKKKSGYSHLVLRFDDDRKPVRIALNKNGATIPSSAIAGTYLNLHTFSNPLSLSSTDDFRLLYEDSLPPQPQWRYDVDKTAAKISVVDLHRWIDIGGSDVSGVSAGMKEALKSWGYVQ